MPKFDLYDTFRPIHLFTEVQPTVSASALRVDTDTACRKPMPSLSMPTFSKEIRRDRKHDAHHVRFSRTLSDATNQPVEVQPQPSTLKATRQQERNALKLSKASPFRPPVPAADRLTVWSSPYAQRHRETLSSSLPSTLVDKAYQAVGDAIATSTRVSYAAGLLRFHQFCDDFEISEEDRMPASGPLLASFVAHCKGSYEGKTISSWLSGVRYWHIINRAPWFGEEEWVNQARTLARKEGTHHRRPTRAPVSLNHLHILRASLDISLPYDAAVWATALTTFFGCRRLGETTVPSPSSFNPAYNVVRSAKTNFRYGRIPGTSSIDIFIPWTKSTKQEGATVVLTSRADDLCPVKAVLNHLAVNNDCPPHSSFFSFRSAAGQGWSHMVKAAFLSTVDGIWAGNSLEKVSGHSFRIGGATALLLAGVPPETVAKTGGWSSLAFLLYWRRIEEVIPLCISQAYSKANLDSVSGSMESFRVASGITRETAYGHA
ncbi:hypothetical protein CVT24_001069 [Panaeolus cyanescens]|uniref:Tyr recombinase domain-containing protein n=1 Tax=Panaeolus cyanescens TaxID=181874 RepID=A0A409W778_9AGAR|nr:hypothetical protein CVT24_001069 [Panaeolus cyanescens]